MHFNVYMLTWTKQKIYTFNVITDANVNYELYGYVFLIRLFYQNFLHGLIR